MKFECVVPVLRQNKGAKRSGWPESHGIYLQEFISFPVMVITEYPTISVSKYEVTAEDLWTDDWEII